VHVPEEATAKQDSKHAGAEHADREEDAQVEAVAEVPSEEHADGVRQQERQVHRAQKRLPVWPVERRPARAQQ
jgi:hypothetical protein